MRAEQVASAFHVVITAFDEDRAGKKATDRIGKMILGAKQRAPLVQMVVPMQVASGKDIGDMSQEALDALLQKTIGRVKSGLRGWAAVWRATASSRFRYPPGQPVAWVAQSSALGNRFPDVWSDCAMDSRVKEVAMPAVVLWRSATGYSTLRVARFPSSSSRVTCSQQISPG